LGVLAMRSRDSLFSLLKLLPLHHAFQTTTCNPSFITYWHFQSLEIISHQRHFCFWFPFVPCFIGFGRPNHLVIDSARLTGTTYSIVHTCIRDDFGDFVLTRRYRWPESTTAEILSLPADIDYIFGQNQQQQE